MKQDLTVCIIQSNYIPWRGYFDIIRDCDLFVIYDDLQFTKGDWRNRNKIKSPSGLIWLTVPVHFKFSQATLIENTMIDYSKPWIEEHKRLLTRSYGESPYFADYAGSFFKILENKFENISQLNVAAICWVNEILEIKTRIMFSSELKLNGKKTDRVLDVLKQVGATKYVSGPSAKNYLEESKFKDHMIELDYKNYDYAEYPQLYGAFEGGVSIVDLLFMCGPNSIKLSKCLTSTN